MTNSKPESINSRGKVFDCITRIVADPLANTEIIKALIVNLRIETGSLPGYKGSGFADKADSITLSRQMREGLENLIRTDLSSDRMYLLVQQLVKSRGITG